MRKFITTLLMLTAFTLLFAVAAFADSTNWSATLLSNATGTSSALRVDKYPMKAVYVGRVSGSAFANYSGTFTLQGSYSASGPWTTVKDINGNAITKTHDTTAAGAVYIMRDNVPYIRAVFTALSGATKNVVTVVVNYAQDFFARP